MKGLTRSELEAIGKNLLNRRNKLLAYHKNESNPQLKRAKAFVLAWNTNTRLTKIMIFLGQPKAPRNFPSGGVASSIEAMNPGEYVIARPKFKP